MCVTVIVESSHIRVCVITSTVACHCYLDMASLSLLYIFALDVFFK